MSVSVAPTLFDVFNARQLTPQQVARTFVPPPHFERIAKQTHALIVGPRGSGKTTLLKMLHPAALESWGHERANEFLAQITFTGVFVATDLNWSEQVRFLGEGRLDPDAHRLFAKAVFTTQVFDALIDSMRYRAHRAGPALIREHRRVTLEEDREVELVQELRSSWQFEHLLPSLDGLKLALTRRLSNIWTLASREAAAGPTGRKERLAAIPFLHLDFLPAAAVAVEMFNESCGERGARWALLFDELELAPAWIRSYLLSCLRSVDQRFLFKLSLSPYAVDIKSEMGPLNPPSPMQDYEEVPLWYVHKEDGYPFCNELLKSIMQARQPEPLPPEAIFGSSVFSRDISNWKRRDTAYYPGSSASNQIQSLLHIDHTFRRYLQTKRIHPDKLHDLSPTRRASELRKARQIISLRLYFRGPGRTLFAKHGQKRRSRKLPLVYGGTDALFAMVEGNPRWFIGIVGRLLKNWTPEGGRVSRSAQVRQVTTASHVFRAMLNTIPVKPVATQTKGLLSLLDPIGNYFSAAAIDLPFDPDPPGSFIVDASIPEEYVKALGRALNAGAIVYVNEQGQSVMLDTLRERRFRLSYVLAPQYQIPLRLGPAVALKWILDRPTPRRRATEATLFKME